MKTPTLAIFLVVAFSVGCGTWAKLDPPDDADAGNNGTDAATNNGTTPTNNVPQTNNQTNNGMPDGPVFDENLKPPICQGFFDDWGLIPPDGMPPMPPPPVPDQTAEVACSETLGDTCDFTCTEGQCAESCLEGYDCCSLHCPGGSCRQVCHAGTSCQASCGGGACIMICKAGATCRFHCGGGCKIECEPGSDCEAICNRGDCRCNEPGAMGRGDEETCVNP